MATSINTRISDELEKKLNEVQEDIKLKAPRGAEVTYSSIVRGGLEKLIEEHEEEKKGIVTVKYDLKSMTNDEIEFLEMHLTNLYKMILDNRSNENPLIKEDNETYYREMLKYKSIDLARNDVFLECQKRHHSKINELAKNRGESVPFKEEEGE